MEAYLYDVKRYYEDSEYPDTQEFIVAGDSEKEREEIANRVYKWYLEHARSGLSRSVLGEPQAVENELYLEKTKKVIEWPILQKKQIEQHKNRPRGVGCIFRGGSPGPQYLSSEDIEDLRESINYFMDDHREGEEPYLFICSNWKLENRLRFGKIAVFEACGIELASDIAQLEFLSDKNEIVYINWCCPIFCVNET